MAQENNIIDLTLGAGITAVAEKGGIAWDVLTPYVAGDIISHGTSAWMALRSTTGIAPSTLVPLDWKLLDRDAVISTTAGNEIRIPEIVEITQANYDLIVPPRPQKLYIIVN